MKCPIAKIASLAVLVAWSVGVVLAQESPSPESLADLARQAKAQRAKSREKSKVYTNEDIEALPPLPMSTTEHPAGGARGPGCNRQQSRERFPEGAPRRSR